MHTKRRYTAILTLMVLFYSSFAAAEVYKWVDAKGETHFSDKPPKSRVSKVSETTKPAKKTAKPQRQAEPKRQAVVAKQPVASQAASLQLASLDATFYDLEKIAEQVVEQRAEPVIERAAEQTPEIKPTQSKAITNLKQTLCRDHRRHLAVLQEKGFEYYYDDKGEPRVVWGVEGFYRQKKRYLSTSEAAKKAKEIAFEIERYCDNPLDKTLQAKARQDWIRSEYCDVSQVILSDLKHPFMRTSEAEIKAQEKEVERFCSEYPANKYRDDERYYPMSLQVERLQQQHFLYR